MQQGGSAMLKEIICDEFKQKKIIFFEGLNVVLGDENGSNSIGKSTFLMIIDFVFGGKDYAIKSTDIQKNVGFHTIKFAFEFNQQKYYFSRNTADTEMINVCDEKYNVCDRISVEQYTDKLKKMYDFGEVESSFRDVVGRYSRVYGKENLNEKHPLDIVSNEKAGQPINALLKLCGLYEAIKEIEEVAKKKKDELAAFKNAQKYNFISNIGVRQRKENDKRLLELVNEKNTIMEELNNRLLDFDSQKADIVLGLKRELSLINRKIRSQKAKLIPLKDNLSGTRRMADEDINNIKKFFPEADLRQVIEIENFHKEIDIVLKEEVKEEISNIEAILRLLEENKEKVVGKIKTITDTENLSQVILFKYAEIQREEEILNNQNSYFDKKVVLDNEKKDAEERCEMVKKQQLIQLQNMLNIKMEELNDIIYKGTKVAPTIAFDKNQYVFETVDDTGTGTCYRGMVLYDLSVLNLTCLPVLIHDSVLLKQIEDIAVEKILEMYNESEKQVFIALDKVSSYSQRSQEILNANMVLTLGPDGDELFGRSWSKK